MEGYKTKKLFNFVFRRQINEIVNLAYYF